MTALIAAIVLPAAAGTGLLLAGRRAERLAGAAGVAVALAVLLLVVVAIVAPRGTEASGIGLDGLSAIVLVLIAAVALPVLAFAAAERQRPAARFTGLMLLFVAAALLAACATTLPALLAGWEVMGATSAVLVATRLDDARAVSGGLTAFLTTRTADLGLYLAAGAAVAGSGSLSLSGLAGLPAPWRDVVAAGVVLAALGKAAQLPFSFWLSRAMAGPSATSALLHSAALVALGGYLLLRAEPLVRATGWAGPLLVWVGLGTAVLLGAVALAQQDLKQLLAASTAAQLGLVVAAAGLGTVAGGAAQLLAHGATKAALLLLAGVWLAAWGERRLAALRGAGRADRLTGVLATVAAAALAGLPPLSIWAAKDLVLAVAGPAALAAGLVAAVLAAAYAGRIVRVVWAHGPERERVPRRTVAPVVPLVAAAVLLGGLAVPAVGDVLARTVGGAAPATPTALQLVSALVAVPPFLLALRFDVPVVPVLARWLDLERAARLLVVRPVLRVGEAAARLDGGFELAVTRGGALQAVARAAARLDRAGPEGLLRAVGGLAAASGRAARRLQTGSVHDYYLLAAVAGAVLVVVAVAVR